MAVGSKRYRRAQEKKATDLMVERRKKVTFVSHELAKSYQTLKTGKFEDTALAMHIKKTMEKLQSNPFYGVKISSKLWPADYVRKFQITNLRKCNLSDGWRLTYTLKGNAVEIVSIVLEWFSHKDYEKRFGYKT